MCDKMVRVKLERDYATFKLEGAEKFLALKGSLRISLKNIDSVSTETVKPLWLAVKIGTHMPPIFWAGTFWTREGVLLTLRDLNDGRFS